jgi:hypothetical protein
VLWLRADSGVVVQNGRVTRWTDQSGHGNDVVMSDSNQQPAYLTSSSDGLPSLVFGGNQYLTGPNMFPALHDYTVSIVAKINNVGTINNLVSGNNHAIYFNNSLYPQVVHNSFNLQEYSTIPMWPSAFSTVTATYSEDDYQAVLYVNSEFADSSFVERTSDSTLLIGSFQHGYFLIGEIQEILIYDRELNASERDNLDHYLRTRYSIPHSPAAPRPDSTFAVLPKPLQLYPRGSGDSATVPITGAIYRSGFDSVYLLAFKNSLPIARQAVPLRYENSIAPFSFSTRIHSELSEYAFAIHLVSPGFDSILARRDSIVCGDVFLIDGQSNSQYGYAQESYHNEYCRCFGLNSSHNYRDTAWAVSLAAKWGDGPSTGAAGLRIQKNIAEQQHIPTCCINGAIAGTPIEAHEGNDSVRFDLMTIYGRMAYRVIQGHLANSAKFLIWDQGESNYADGYRDKFLRLYRSWNEDYPNLQKIYLIQMRPNNCAWGNIDMRDIQRSMGDSLSNIEPIASAAIPGQDGCHYYDAGYDARGDRLFSNIARDFYHATDTANLRCPNAVYAYYSNPNHSQIAILFSPPGVQLHSTNDTLVANELRTLKDYFYIDDDTTRDVQSIAFNRDTLFVNLDKPSTGKSIGYLPDQDYRDTAMIYEGPWIVNSRGIGALLWHHLTISDQPLSVHTSPRAGEEAILYPNPATRTVNITDDEWSGPIDARLIAASGAIAWSGRIVPQGCTVSIQLEGVPHGAYLIQLSDGKKQVTKKLVLDP